jgi:hypothetical protein
MKRSILGNQIVKTLSDVYGAGPLVFEPAIVEWALTRVCAELGGEKAARELKALNSYRSKMGVGPVMPIYGTEVWAPYMGR